jgi:hypothetical protein
LLTDATQAALAQSSSPEESEIAKQYFGAATQKIKNTYETLSPLVEPAVLRRLHAEVGKGQLEKTAPANKNLAKYKAHQQLLKSHLQRKGETKPDDPSQQGTVNSPIGDTPTSRPTGATAKILLKRQERKSILKNPIVCFHKTLMVHSKN